MANKLKEMMDKLPSDAEVMNTLTSSPNDLMRRARARKGMDMSNRITEKSYEGPNVKPDKKDKKKPKSSFKKLKDTSGDYYSADGISGSYGSASGEIGPDMGRVNKGGYDPEENMKRGGKVKCMAKGGSVKSSASRRADGCAIRGKTKGRMV
jgi:hypothetical protein